MMETAKEALEKIKRAEGLAEKKQAEARGESYRIIQAAKAKRLEMIKSAEERVSADSDKLKEQLEEEASREEAFIGEKAKGECEALWKKGTRNIEKALEFLQSKIGL